MKDFKDDGEKMDIEAVNNALRCITKLSEEDEMHSNYLVLKEQADLLLNAIIKSHVDYLRGIKRVDGRRQDMTLRVTSEYYREETARSLDNALKGSK